MVDPITCSECGATSMRGSVHKDDCPRANRYRDMIAAATIIAKAIDRHTEAMHSLSRSTRMIAMGENEPGGLEAVAMALADCRAASGPSASIAAKLEAIADALERPK